MQIMYSALAIMTISTLVAAQDPSGLIPNCAIPCLDEAIMSVTTCGYAEYVCQCEATNQSKIRAAALKCIASSCPPDKLSDVIRGAAAVCAAATSSAVASSASSTAASSPTVGPPISSSKPFSTVTITTTISATRPKCKETGASNDTDPSTFFNGTTSPTIKSFDGSASQFATSLGAIFAIGFAVFAVL